MKFRETDIKGLYIIELDLVLDERGFFARNFCKDELAKNHLTFDIAQASLSLNKNKGTLRGMHFQIAPKAEDKIIQCLRGAIYDVAVDLRKDSPTFGKWVAEELNEENRKMFLIPKGFAHGFITLTDDCLLQYYMSEFYSSEHSYGMRWDDPFLNINWPLMPSVISEKDKNWPLFKNEK